MGESFRNPTGSSASHIRSLKVLSSYHGYQLFGFTQQLSVFLILLAHVITPTTQQSMISLNNAQWFVSNSNNSIVARAQVPGGIYSDLRRNSILKQDILFGKNDLAYRWVGNENWTYTTSFAIDHQIARSQSVKLVLHGVDTISTVYLNGEEVGTTDNMFVRYKFDIKPHLRLVGLPNVLVVKFEPPVKYSARKSHQSIRENRGKIIPPYCPSAAQRGECHVNFIRKMQASFSWDWGPAFPSVGIYKDVFIEFGSFGIIRDILVETRRLPPLVPPTATTTPPPPLIISGNIRQQVRKHAINKTMPYIRAPPYYMSMSNERPLAIDQEKQVVDISTSNEANQQLMEENWLLKTTLVAEMVQPSFGYNVRIEFNLNNLLHYESEHINVVANAEGYIRLGFNLRVDTSRMRIKPWWPNNAGGQTLYRLTARMMPIPSPDNVRSQPDRTTRNARSDEDFSLQFRNKPLQTQAVPGMVFLATQLDASTHNIQHVSEKQISFGFRTVELVQEPVTPGNLEDGMTFNFRVNGVDLFAMGSNWIPASVLPEHSNDLEYIRYLLQSAKDANMNMLRVWGGGLYESDDFYRLADEMGIMIWHDFMFACALYPADDEFLASVKVEIEQQVQRLQHHPSIVLWAGNNENEMAIAGPWWPEVMMWNKKLREAYATLYVDTIRPIVQILDPSRPYVESSPSNGLFSRSQQFSIARTPNDNKWGDVHHYDYYADSFDWTSYPSARFASEYGFQSYPSFNALSSITTANDWKYPLTSNILHRQHRITGESEIKLQIKMHFNELESGGVEKFKNFLYVSQLTQAIAIKTETEFYRRNRFIDPETKLGKTMGALYWQLNDVWQAPTWSSIEYGGKWKMLHYFARRFFFPIQVIPYLIQSSSPSLVGSSLPQIFSAPSSLLSSSSVGRQQQQQSQQQQQQFGDSPQQQQQQQQQQQSLGGQVFVVDLVRDDLFHLLDSFNVTIRFYRWTSFIPIWQDSVYVKNTRPQNVTRIYEQDLARIIRQPGIISASSGVFQVIIEQQSRLGLSQIENYLMPVAPSRVTAMRVAKISVELVQGPFELTEVRSDSPRGVGPSSQWSCAYRLTLVSDSIAMFVWLDLNLLDVDLSEGFQGEKAPVAGSNDEHGSHSHLRPLQERPDPLPGVSAPTPVPFAAGNQQLLPQQQQPQAPGAFKPPENIRLHINAHHTAHSQNYQPTIDSRDHRSPGGSSSDQAVRQSRRFVTADTEGATEQQQPRQPLNPAGRRREQANRFMDASRENILRYQFSDNSFNIFEPSKVIDLYLSRCLAKSQIEAALEIRSLADSL